MTYEEWLSVQSGGGDITGVNELNISNPDGLPSEEATRFGTGLAKSVGLGALTGNINPLGALTDSMFSSMGVTEDTEGKGAVVGKGTRMATSLLSMLAGAANPALGVLVGLSATPLADAIGDFTGLRDFDKAREQLEDELGEIPGRQAYANADPGSLEDMSTLEGRTFQEAADLVGTQTAIGGPESRANYTQQQSFFQTLADEITQSQRNKAAQYEGFSGGAYSYGDPTSYYGGRDSSMGGHNVGGAQGSSTGTGGGYNDGSGGVTGL